MDLADYNHCRWWLLVFFFFCTLEMLAFEIGPTASNIQNENDLVEFLFRCGCISSDSKSLYEWGCDCGGEG